MSAGDLHTCTMNLLVDRIRIGDRSAQDELVRRIERRVERISRAMLRNFPRVKKAEDTCDVMQDALMRLVRSLQNVKPSSTREFFGLTAEQVRRTLLDMARYHQSARRDVDRLAPPHHGLEDSSAAAIDLPDKRASNDNLDVWEAFHVAVADLPTEERECVSLIFYHQLTQEEVAEIFGTTERTVRRRWVAACLKIKDKIGHVLPIGE